MKKDPKEQEQTGREDRSIRDEKQDGKVTKQGYPYHDKQQIQADNQPEFTDDTDDQESGPEPSNG